MRVGLLALSTPAPPSIAPTVMRRVLVFPCGSEIGLEVHRSVRFSRHFELVGASSVDDHGKFVYGEYIGGLPFHPDPLFIPRLHAVVAAQGIDAIFPTMDAVAAALQDARDQLGCRIIGSDPAATATCASKTSTYHLLRAEVPTPRVFARLEDVPAYPLFIKPDQGYGSRHCLKAESPDAARAFVAGKDPASFLLLEYLPGPEWTVDCFSDRHGQLRFHAARRRNRIASGISVNTTPSPEFAAEFARWAAAINQRLRPRGAWFFQAKLHADGQPRLLEVAARFGGSSGVFRCLGINFALLSLFDAFDHDVAIEPNDYGIELDRALANRYRTTVKFSEVFVDLDDCLLLGTKVNAMLVAFLYQAVSDGKRVTLLTRHRGDLAATLKNVRLAALFDRVLHLTAAQPKSAFIDTRDSILIDDSFAERREVARNAGIPVFSPDMVEALL